jgi:DNA-binding transcriptional LysR family regulator
LPRYRDRHPGIDVQLIEGSATQQRIRLDRGEVHVAIRTIVEVAPLWIAMLDHLIAGKEGHASLKG